MTNKTNEKLIAAAHAHHPDYECGLYHQLADALQAAQEESLRFRKVLLRTDELYEMTLRQLGDKITELHEAETKLAAIRDAMAKVGVMYQADLDAILNTTNAQKLIEKADEYTKAHPNAPVQKYKSLQDRPKFPSEYEIERDAARMSKQRKM